MDNARDNLFAGLPRDLRQKAFDQLKPTLSATAPAGLDEKQALQARASSGTVLLHLLEGTPERELAAPILKAYETLVKAEPNQRLKENLIFHLSNSPAAQTGEAKQVADALMTRLAPLKPPYEQWFADGNTTVRLDKQVGDEFLAGFRGKLASAGWQETAAGRGVYTRRSTEPGVGETRFEIRTRLGGGAGQLFVSNLCVGKSQIDAMKEKFPNLQYATTSGSSSVDTDIDALAKFISQRKGWDTITPCLDRVDGHRDRNNFVTPTSTLTREKMLDRDNDVQADSLDKHFNVSTFSVAVNTQREFRPVKQDRPAGRLDGTRVGIAAQVLNTVSEFNGVLKEVNEHSRVVAGGWFEPRAGEADVVKFEKARGKDGQPEYRMTVSARYAHMSEEALRATCVYELNRWLQSSGEQRMDPVDRKLLAVIGYAQSLDIDDGWRDDELFTQFLSRYNLPSLNRSDIQPLLDAELHDSAGSEAMVSALKARLTPAVLAELRRPAVGAPVRYLERRARGRRLNAPRAGPSAPSPAA